MPPQDKNKNDLWAEFQRESGASKRSVSGKTLAIVVVVVLMMIIAAFARAAGPAASSVTRTIEEPIDIDGA
jgi:uncharacterized membrane protein YedE/YeeE